MKLGSRRGLSSFPYLLIAVISLSEGRKVVSPNSKHDGNEDKHAPKSWENRTDFVPVMFVKGTHYQVGLTIGKTFGPMIKDLINTKSFYEPIWKAYQSKEGKRRYQHSLSLVQKRYPQYVDEIKGTAKGSGIPFERLFVLTIDTILEAEIPEGTGCSAILCNMGGDNVFVGHTEDTVKEVTNHIYIVHAHIVNEAGKTLEQFSSVTYAGYLMGYTSGYLNSGMIFSVNTLFPPVNIHGMPRAFVARALLAANNMNDINKTLRSTFGGGISDGMSLNLAYLGDDGITWNLRNFEVLPQHTASNKKGVDNTEGSIVNSVYVPAGKCFMHFNKYLRMKDVKQQETAELLSTARMNTLSKYPTPQGIDDVLQMLSDQSNPEYPVFVSDDAKKNGKLSFLRTVEVSGFSVPDKTWKIFINRPSESDPVATLPLEFSNVPVSIDIKRR